MFVKLRSVAELHEETLPFSRARAYLTVSWTDQGAKPTLITAIERPMLSEQVCCG